MVAPRTDFDLHAGAGIDPSTVHGFTVGMIWGAATTSVAAIPIALFVKARTPSARR